MNTARQMLCGFGTQTAAVGAGGDAAPANTGATELWNGSTWTTNPTALSVVRYGLAAGGTQASGVVFGGYGGGIKTATEEWTGSALTTRTITAS